LACETSVYETLMPVKLAPGYYDVLAQKEGYQAV